MLLFVVAVVVWVLSFFLFLTFVTSARGGFAPCHEGQASCQRESSDASVVCCRVCLRFRFDFRPVYFDVLSTTSRRVYLLQHFCDHGPVFGILYELM